MNHFNLFFCAFILETKEMKNTVSNDPQKLVIIFDLVRSSVFLNPLYANKDIARDKITLTVIKRDDVCVIIVLEEILINFKNFLIGAKYKSQFTDFFVVFRDEFFNPGF